MGKKRKAGRFLSHGEIKSTQRVPDQRGPGGFSLFVERDDRERIEKVVQFLLFYCVIWYLNYFTVLLL